MDRPSNIAFIVGIGITGVALIGVWGQQAGTWVLIFIAIWVFLTLPKRGVLRRRWEKNFSTQRVFDISLLKNNELGKGGQEGFPESVAGEKHILKLDVCINAIPEVTVDSIEVELGRKRLISDWKPNTIVLRDRWQYVYFGIPSWVTPKKHNIRLVARINKGEWKSDSFMFDFTLIDEIKVS